ncbi:interleukin enhancer binding factor 2 [Trichuris trichiura]|uniref:Interleukin enhancer binding factor 2 n=1 Tax=Trichuris trichiura TaxID=36087 RepID=A0A077ZFB0_TRITR|nr:interleukin enhancer binding factor 2 [Trichuris trichiura]
MSYEASCYQSDLAPRGSILRPPFPLIQPMPLANNRSGKRNVFARTNKYNFRDVTRSNLKDRQDSCFDLMLTQDLLKRNFELVPERFSVGGLSYLVELVVRVIEGYMLDPEAKDDDLAIATVKSVGSFEKRTLITGKSVADVAVVFRGLPSAEAISSFGNCIASKIMEFDSFFDVTCQTAERGFNIVGHMATVRVIVCTLPSNYCKVTPEYHMDLKTLFSNSMTISHTRWFEQFASHPAVRIIVRVVKDIKSRYKGFDSLNPWMIEVLVHYSVTSIPLCSTIVGLAFMRFLMLLSSNALSPVSIGLFDPCNAATRIHGKLSLEEMNSIRQTAQFLLNLMAIGGHKLVLGLDKCSYDVTECGISLNGFSLEPIVPLINEENRDRFDRYLYLLKNKRLPSDNDSLNAQLASQSAEEATDQACCHSPLPEAVSSVPPVDESETIVPVEVESI